MAKVIKAIVLGVIFAVVMFYTFGAGGLAWVGGPSGIIGAMKAGAVFGGLAGVASMFIRKPSMDMDGAIGNLNMTQDTQVLGKMLFGNSAGAADVIYAEHHGTKKYLSYIIATAAHECNSYGALYLDDELINFGSSGDAAIGDWANTLWRTVRLGTDTQASIAVISGDSWQWPSDAEGFGMAHYRLRYKIGKKKIEKGIPRRVTQVMEGLLVYDPRLDTTRGGSGAHRANDQTTWEYANDGVDIGRNWTLVVVWYLLGWKVNSEMIVGMGVDPDDIDWPQVIAMANVCETTIDSEARYFIDGIMAMSNKHEHILSQLEGAIGGAISQVGGKWYIWVPHDDLTSLMTITNDDLLTEAGVEFIPSGPLEDLFNIGRGRYIEPDDLYQPIPYPDVIESSAVTSDGRDRVLSHDLSVITSVARAERIVRGLVRRSRFSATWKIAMGPKGMLLQPFAVVTLNCQETNNQNELCRIIDMEFSATGLVVLELLEEDASIYDTTTALGTPITQGDPNALDAASSVNVTDLNAVATSYQGTAGDTYDGVKVTWTDPGGMVRRTEIQYKRTTESDWVDVPMVHIDFQEAIIKDVNSSGSTMNVRARHITVFDIIGDWLDTTFTAGSTVRSVNVINVGGSTAADVSASTTNFNARNDRIATTVVLPSIASDGTAIDHTIRSNGLVADISFEWAWSGDVDDIDGFYVHIRSSTSGTSYNFGSTPVDERVFVLPTEVINSTVGAFILYGAPAALYYTFGVTAYRVVDPDINTDEIMFSNSGTPVQPALGAEDPYQPSSTAAFAGNITGTIDGRVSDDVLFVSGGGTFTGSLFASNREGTIGMKLNHDTFTSANPGELYISGYNIDGVFTSATNFSFWADGEKFTTGVGGAAKIHNFYANESRANDRWYWIVYDIDEGADFTVVGVTRNGALCYQTGDQWYYDNNGADIAFTIKGSYYIIGAVYLDATTNTLVAGNVWADAFSMHNASSQFPRYMENMNALAAAGAVSTFSAQPITSSTDAGSTATMNISSSTLNLGPFSVSYSSGSIAGLAFETTYHVYADDPGYGGGAVTYVATTSTQILAEADGRIYFGSHTTVADGGGTGGGSEPPPGDCVGIDMYLVDRQAALVEPGTDIYILSEDGEYAYRDKVASVEYAFEECVVITTTSAELICSVSTPLTLQDGRIINILEALGEGAAVLSVNDNVLTWEPILTIAIAGTQEVAKIHVGGKTYGAGKDKNKLIFTHNPWKP